MGGRTIFTGAALVAGVVAAASLPGESLGINVLATGGFFLLAVVMATRGSLHRSDWILIGLGTVLGGFSVIRAAEWVVVFNLLVALLALSVAVAGAQNWFEVVIVPFRTVRFWKGTTFVLIPLMKQVSRDRWASVAPVLRTTALSLSLLIIFGALFISADRAFASFAERLLLPEWDVSLLPARLITMGMTVAVVGAVTRLSPRFTAPPRGFPRDLQAGAFTFELPGADWKVALVVIDLLFALFVAVQITVLFGGHDHVLETTGLTYAEYARQGFFQLIAVAILTLVVVAAVVWLGRAEGYDRAWRRVLLGTLCVLTLVILASASKRMDLYQEAYGFTRLRLFVDGVIIFLAGMFFLLIAAGVPWRGKWLPRAVVALAATTVIGFNVYNPDAAIAKRNVERYERTGDIDLVYLSSLSADAVPVVLELPGRERSCVLGLMELRLSPPESFWSWNLSRQRAEKVIGAGSTPSPQVDCLPSDQGTSDSSSWMDFSTPSARMPMSFAAS